LFGEVGPVKAPVLSILLAVGSGSARAASPSADLNLVIQETCVTCHNETTLLGNLSLEAFDVAKAEKNAVVAEKVIRKLRAGMMPPSQAASGNDAPLPRYRDRMKPRSKLWSKPSRRRSTRQPFAIRIQGIAPSRS
jgi:hypothetical protein